MIAEYNRQHNRIYSLSERGFRQAERNNSHQMYLFAQVDILYLPGSNRFTFLSRNRRDSTPKLTKQI